MAGQTRTSKLGTEHGTVQRVPAQLGYGTEAVRPRVRQADIDEGHMPGVSTGDAARLKTLKQENRELKRANEILKTREQRSFFGRGRSWGGEGPGTLRLCTVTQLLSEVDTRFNTGSMRNIYSPDVRTANELVVDQIARAMGKDPLKFRLEFLKDERVRAVLKKVAEVGKWGRAMPAGTAQGIAIHKEYKGSTAVLVEIDCRPETVNRKVRDAVTGPRVTKAVIAVDAGLVVNPQGLKAQMMGGFSDGLALALTSSLHLEDGHFLEASWDNYFYTRQWNIPPELEVVIVDSDQQQPGGAGEAAVASSFAAVACAFARATGKMPKKFPINHDDPIKYDIKSFVPPVPESPTDGLQHTY